MEPRRDARVDVFFYGSFVNPAVLRRNGFAAERLERGAVVGLEVAVRPTATLDRASIAEAARAHGFPGWYVERVAGA